MVAAKLKCRMCGTHFETEMLDKDDPNERHRAGSSCTVSKVQ